MSGALDLDVALSWAEFAVSIALLVRLVIGGLIGRYWLFALYIVGNGTEVLVPALIPYNTNLYFRAFVGFESLRMILTALVILDMYSLVFKDLPGISRTAHTFIRYALLAAIAFSVALMSFEQVATTLFQSFYVFDRAITSSLLFFVLLITGFLSYFPVPLRRNIIFYTVGYAVFFLAKAAGFFLLTTSGFRWAAAVSIILDGVSLACLVLWTWKLTPSGETQIVQFGLNWRREDEARVREQLQAINASLLRVAKK
jgi:hypothetical protein